MVTILYHRFLIKGALCTLSEKDLDNPKGPYIKVESVATALKDIAEFYRKQLSCKIIGITGSVGKQAQRDYCVCFGRKI